MDLIRPYSGQQVKFLEFTKILICSYCPVRIFCNKNFFNAVFYTR